MFTGIIEEVGRIRAIERQAVSARLTVAASKVLSDVHLGDSIAVNGVCLTVTSFGRDYFCADVMHETLNRSSLGALGVKSPVNLERAMLAGGRFGGHIVSGHIDGTGTIRDVRRDGNAVWYTIQVPEPILRLIVEKGSIAIDGISLTVARVDHVSFSVSIIPHTLQETALAFKRAGDIVNLEKRYRSKNTDVFALQGINLAINKGDIFGVIGKSGAGKSTLVRCINMLERPTGGSIFFEGKDMCRLSESELRAARRSMGMIFQQFNLLMQRTARQNVCFPLELIGMDKVQARKRAEELLDLVGLANRMDSYPSQLSGGQKQRVAIARALATNPQVLLCDEATSALDPATTDSILSLIKDINRDLGITAVIITHEMSVIEKICSHVAIIHRGKIVEHGEVEEVFFHPRTEVARRLVMPEALQNLPQENLYRLIFNGRSSFEPVIANMVLECHCPVNIMYADTRDIGGIAFGQMVLQLPECPESRRSILEFAKSRNILLEEMKHV